MNRDNFYRNAGRWGRNLITCYHYWQEINEDFWSNHQTTLGQKLWAYRRGFRSSKIIMYGLNEQNYRQYMPDLDFHRLGSVNGRYRRWIDDKLTMKYVLHALGDYLPEYYYMLGEGKESVISRLLDCPKEYGTEMADIVRLLETKGCLAVKLMGGSQGVGFLKLSCGDGYYYINDEQVEKAYLSNFLSGLRGYIITEFLIGHPELSRICGFGANSVRIITIKQPGTSPFIVGALMRFSTAESGTVDNISAGGVASMVDITTGRFSNGRKLAGDEWLECSRHPDTGMLLEGTVPNWKEIKEKITAVCNYLPLLVWLGFDIIVLDGGFKIVEINSRPGIALHNYYQPLYADREQEQILKQALNQSRSSAGFTLGGGKL